MMVSNSEDLKKTLTRADLISALRSSGLSSAVDADELFESVLEAIVESICADKVVRIGSFGSFQKRSKAQRTGRNPRTGELKTISARNVITFKPSVKLKERMNNR